MIDKLKSLIKRNLILTKISQLMAHYKLRQAIDEANRRRKLDLMDYASLAKDLPMVWQHPIIDNNYYGINNVLSEFCGVSKINDRLLVEHGVIFGSLSYDILNKSFAKEVLTFSDYREEMIRKKRTYNTHKIGPHIHYAKGLYSSDELKILKSKWGKVLLIFPSHSIKALTTEYSTDDFIEEIKKRAVDFDNVLICLYWKDIQLGRDKLYRDQGFIVVTSGHYNDRWFLDRLKTLICLSDFTMSNDVGTHLGYCVFLGKPHYIFRQIINHSIGKDKKVFDNEINSRDDDERRTLEEVKTILTSAFSKFNYDINDEQKRLVNYYWGFDNIKDKNALKQIIG